MSLKRWWKDPAHRRWTWLGLSAVLLAGVVAFVLFARPFWQLSAQFSTAPSREPSRLYGRSTVLSRGGWISPQNLARHLANLGYARAGAAGRLEEGRYRDTSRGFEVYLRRFPTPRGVGGGALLEITADGNRIRQLVLGGKAIESVLLEPPLLTSYYGPDVKERRWVPFAEMPNTLVESVLAAEDAGFFAHSGVSFTGILRALWANARGGEVRQGGSTLTQQLVKNLFLTQERTVKRKVKESLLAMFLEMRFSKQQILEAYLNEIYLGSAGGVNLHGMGAASRAYFGKDASELDLAEAATLAGIIPAPGNFSPLSHPDKALERRNLVLRRLEELGRWPAAEIAHAREQPLGAVRQPPLRRRAPYFADLAALEAARRFRLATLEDKGLTLLSTLSFADQRSAEEAIGWGLEQLEQGWQKKAKTASPLQVSLVSLDPRDGSILAYLGGRSYRQSQFDRASQARRQAGSAFKPVVYATALEHGVVTPASRVEDAPLTLELAGQSWTPMNDDDEFAGWVTVRQAVERSLNVPTARVAMETGLDEIVATAKAMGVSSDLKPYPALALGAFEVSPLDLATVYATLAAGGIRSPVHALTGVLDDEGQPMNGDDLAERQRVLSPVTAFLMTSILQGVVDHGTGAGARKAGLGDPVAGKTGTTNGRRDSWFGGYAPNRATVVWVGYDDNTETRMSGSRAALPIWARFTLAVRPAGGYPGFAVPEGVATAVIDPASGELATVDCPEQLTEYFQADYVPTAVCSLHRGWSAVPVTQPGGVEADERRPVRRWLRRIFGEDKKPAEDREGDGG